jgi:ABC-type multidrug transport system ATPase subunit/predicted component of type VI protein secretion system
MRLLIKSDVDSLNGASLSGDTILVGHDPAQCKLCLDHGRWPAVARLHAEFRVVNGVCCVFDLNSGSGTYVDGSRVIHSSPVRIGSRIQFGQGGPQVTVTHVELIDSLPPPHALARAPRPRQVHLQTEAAKAVPAPVPANDGREAAALAFLEVAGDYPANVSRLELTKGVVRVGRSQEMDIVFDIAAGYISRAHAEIRHAAGSYVLIDLNSFNGTFLNRQRIAGQSLLCDGDIIQLGIRGPVLRFHQGGLGAPSPLPAAAETHRDLAMAPTISTPSVLSLHGQAPARPQTGISGREPTYVLSLEGKSRYVIGRAWDCDVKLDGLQVSKRHATLTVMGSQVVVEDNHSTNGVYVNGLRLGEERAVGPQDVVQIGPFLLRADVRRGIEVFDMRAQMRIDSVGLTKVVPADPGPGMIKLLDNISLTVRPNEFVGLLGPSGAGKSTFIDALNGMRPATAGQVLVNNLDLYQHLDWLRQAIGYVPQDDIIHRELTVYRTLHYVARLRLAEDASEDEVNSITAEVLDITGLTEQRYVPVTQLSGGQRKRVAVAVELLTKPSIIFLDDPTSGLDPATEEKIMFLFRQIADSGHTVILTTHAMENVWLFDKIVILMQGKLIFYGTPSEALTHLKAASYKEIYDKLEEPVARRAEVLPPPAPDTTPEQWQERKLRLAQIREEVAETWRNYFQQTPQYDENVRQPQSGLPLLKPASSRPRARAPFKNAVAQWRVLCQRYGEVLRRDTFNLKVLFAQAPIIGFLTWLAAGAGSPLNFPYFILSLMPVWFGVSVAAREVIRERAVYKRERMVNLGLLPYVGSKVAVLSVIVSLQCLVLWGTLKSLTLFDFKLPGLFFGVPQLLIMILTGAVGVALGLLVSASVKTSETATSLVPLLLIPQLLFCGLAGVPKGATKAVGALMPATWSFDEMKRLAARNVEVLWDREEEAEPVYNNEGRGLSRQIGSENERTLEEKDQDTRDDKTGAESKDEKPPEGTENTQRKMTANEHQGRKPANAGPELTPAKPGIIPTPNDLSDYVDFLHPWGAVWLNPIVLLLMFLTFTAATISVLRAQDIP